ncbi:TetR/AcrR family transcriptional regulator [Microbacterium gorillae]|uniref:TetR/AcrR family transcriptional regulator n=1 Tax=Microbacterium gorillae TaxID=1231063 RepID=UPI0018A86A8D|nr:TetR/AcrR family transcriptional regulator [Microbacterium gorillae]
MDSQQGDLRPSSVLKRDAMLSAARDRFLTAGFDRTSMDEVAAAAGVAKQTVYSRFGSKENLFLAVVQAATSTAFAAADVVPGSEESLDDWLSASAARLAEAVVNPDLLRLRRLVIAEAERFPALAEAFWAGGAERTVRALSVRIAAFQESGALRAGDPLVMAEHLNWLVLGRALNEAMFRDVATPNPDLAVAAFHRAYATP